MRFVFIFPCLRNFGWNSLGTHQEGIYIQHAIPSLAAVLKEAGHEVACIDLREETNWDSTRRSMEVSEADMFGVHMPTYDFHEAAECARIAHELGKPIITGGPHPSICPEQVLNETEFDHVFIGEGEVTLPKFLKNPEDYDRLVRCEVPDLATIPIEDREIFNMEKILATKHSIYPERSMTIISGRGCPFKCSFCKPGEDLVFGKKFRVRPMDIFIEEFQMLADRYDYGMIHIDDDSFTIIPKYVEEFCERYASIGRPFSCQTRVDFIVKHPDLVRRLKSVGLKFMILGFESGSQRILDMLEKNATVEMNLEAARTLHEIGIDIWGNFIFGIPTETKQEIFDTVQMVWKIRPTHFSPSFYTPIFGTKLYEYCKENDLLLSEDPAFVGQRYPNSPKVKGVDYEFVKQALQSAAQGARGG